MAKTITVKQKGIALIIVLLSLVVIVSISASMSERLFIQFQRLSQQTDYEQAYWYSISAENLAKIIIKKSFQNNQNINLSQMWAINEQIYPLENGYIKGKISDKQACFNINALSFKRENKKIKDRPYLVEVFQTLLKILDINDYQAETIADSTWKFIEKNNDVNSLTEVKDIYYENKFPPYLAPKNLISDTTELRSVHQVSSKTMKIISPFICALPTNELHINVNTIITKQAKLLSALFLSHLSEVDSLSLIEQRPFHGWSSVKQFISEPKIASIHKSILNQAQQYLGVDSTYFELDSEIVIGKTQLRLRSLLSNYNRTTTKVVRRRFGGIYK
ncbi:type II secretion system minor pseudopilin GspK [Candidatus Photodesmus anomalopis]|uniref:Type II secretion system protein K n=1 Tax=Candidatus Photodesmus katoptron Akat1 TaxID=1236703 RepID=S3EH67_9GAMM|nr:type II secretion system minor pseudopilin GspK [Candidatus Photodesmus katoptron]EPE37533.1 general secretion pathway protein K [Candidatus Photodesmus katoptron Akat1]